MAVTVAPYRGLFNVLEVAVLSGRFGLICSDRQTAIHHGGGSWSSLSLQACTFFVCSGWRM